MAASHSKASPCPVCGGYAGAYKKEKRCKGFAGREGDLVYCQVPNDCLPIAPLGYALYPYRDFEVVSYKDLQ